ncbi:MAG: succinylglutamate desuccinylase/aspartoacylase family protein [Rickettsiales bacterium]|jgi:uncharacterized protein|nr:succinylglutamate desuccinylase/aspartoacylase family protein [Rickettsiales bacterium]
MENLEIGGVQIMPGDRKIIHLEIAKLYDFTEMYMPVEVIRGKKPGPTLFVSAAIHGDEINGVEVARRLLGIKLINSIKGTLIVVPIVNVFGFNNKSRYLPDRRDLNRCFPGSEKGSLASNIAYQFMKEIVSKSTHGIDLHTGAIHRSNLPQIRACLSDPETKQLAHAFNTPVIVNSDLKDGSLREAAKNLKIPMLLFEGGEALRYNENVIKFAFQGIISVMREIGMLRPLINKRKKDTFIAKASYWARATNSGILLTKKHLGDLVEENEVLGIITDPFGINKFEIISRKAGIIIGIVQMPLVNEGDASFHIATFNDPEAVSETVDLMDEYYT